MLQVALQDGILAKLTVRISAFFGLVLLDKDVVKYRCCRSETDIIFLMILFPFANYVYLQSEINIKISDTAPSKYMGTVVKQCETKQPVYGGITDLNVLKKNLEDNCIPEDFINMEINDYGVFLEKRRNLMAKMIRSFYESLC